jgi:hypothetical protein
VNSAAESGDDRALSAAPVIALGRWPLPLLPGGRGRIARGDRCEFRAFCRRRSVGPATFCVAAVTCSSSADLQIEPVAASALCFWLDLDLELGDAALRPPPT